MGVSTTVFPSLPSLYPYLSLPPLYSGSSVLGVSPLNWCWVDYRNFIVLMSDRPISYRVVVMEIEFSIMILLIYVKIYRSRGCQVHLIQIKWLDWFKAFDWITSLCYCRLDSSKYTKYGVGSLDLISKHIILVQLYYNQYNAQCTHCPGLMAVVQLSQWSWSLGRLPTVRIIRKFGARCL